LLQLIALEAPDDRGAAGRVRRLAIQTVTSTVPAQDSSQVGAMGVDVDVDFDPIVELDKSEAMSTRLPPSSPSTHAVDVTRAPSAQPVHVQRPRWRQGRRAAPPPSTSPLVNDQVDVDDQRAAHPRPFVTSRETLAQLVALEDAFADRRGATA